MLCRGAKNVRSQGKGCPTHNFIAFFSQPISDLGNSKAYGVFFAPHRHNIDLVSFAQWQWIARTPDPKCLLDPFCPARALPVFQRDMGRRPTCRARCGEPFFGRKLDRLRFHPRCSLLTSSAAPSGCTCLHHRRAFWRALSLIRIGDTRTNYENSFKFN